jgi:hypothetical protein
MKMVLKSRWRGELEEFFKFRRTNFTSEWPEAKLRRFDQFAAEHPDLQLPEAIAAWLERDPKRHPTTIWTQMLQDAQALKPKLLPQSTLGKAVSYLINEYPALIGYLESGTYCIDNNLVENSIRVPAVGRRRWLFIGHPEAGWRSAVIYSLIVSCRRRGINPQAYLSDVLRRLPSMNITQIEALLPECWKPLPPAAPAAA